MSTPSSSAKPTARLADRLAAARRERFVGRVAELELIRQAVLADEPPFAVLHVHGPGGVGKTMLLGEFARIADEWGRWIIQLDGRNLAPSPAGFLLALGMAMGLAEDASPLDALAQQPRSVLLIDTYEALAPLDAWLRETFLPQLPTQSLVVIAGRARPAPAWQTAPGWEDLVRVVSLRNLRPTESRAYLAARGVPDQWHHEALAFTHGHPLALSLVADVLIHGDDLTAFDLAREPDVVRMLLERFVQHVPSPLHRRALEVCAHMRVTNEPLLAAALEAKEVADLFAWLRGLSFVEQGPQGLFPHDLVRDVLDTDLRWRNPEEYRRLHHRVRGAIVRQLQAAQGIAQQRAFFDLLYLHRNSPLMKPFQDWASLGTAYAEPATPEDVPAILEMVRCHEGEESARIARHWLRAQPAAFTVFRGAGRELIGFIAELALHAVTSDDLAADPAVSAAWAFAQTHGPARPGEEMVYHRFAMGRDTYQAVSSAMNMVAMTCSLQWLTNPRLAWSFLAIADPDYWRPAFSYLNLRRSPDTEFAVGGRRYGVFTHDWRVEPALAWLETMGERELVTDLRPEALETAQPPPLVVLSQPDFADAVRRALHDYARPTALGANPLLRSRLATELSDGDPDPTTLQALIREAAETLRGNPKDEKFFRAIHRTYLEPAHTQELAAELLGLPFSTYRYHLTTGIARLTERLWRRELYGREG
ncbi:MAG: hypothetical protein K0S78_4164 [Thermomicrobiales bacterium]|jgi:hypothetical protein|nr:hypothetical protein [Thermomicrobiales bacterium]